jgi:acyl carrier protein
MMTPEMIDENLKEILNYYTGKPRKELIPTATFEDLDIDSLDCIEITMDIEGKFGIQILDEELDSFKCLGDIWALVNKKMAPSEPEKVQDENQNNN